MKKFEDIMWALECCSHKKDSDECENCAYFSGCAVTESGAFTELAHDALELLREYDDALRLMVYQYCTVEHGDKDEFFNRYMSAGENAFKLLKIENYQEVPEDWLGWQE